MTFALPTGVFLKASQNSTISTPTTNLRIFEYKDGRQELQQMIEVNDVGAFMHRAEWKPVQIVKEK